MYVKVDLKAIILWELTHVEDADIVWCKVCDTTVRVCYNTTANNQEQQKSLHELLEMTCRMKGEKVVSGDLNHRTINWNQMEAGAEWQEFLDLTEKLFLHHHVREPKKIQIHRYTTNK